MGHHPGRIEIARRAGEVHRLQDGHPPDPAARREPLPDGERDAPEERRGQGDDQVRPFREAIFARRVGIGPAEAVPRAPAAEDVDSSINYPAIAIIQDKRIVFYIDDKELLSEPEKFYHEMDSRVFLLKLIPGSDGKVLENLIDAYDAVIIESFGVGGIPTYGDDCFQEQIRRFVDAGKLIVMATQVTHEGSDMSVYRVGQIVKNTYRLPESYDMTLESTIAKTMWILGQSREPEKFRDLFYQTINHDMLFSPMDGEYSE